MSLGRGKTACCWWQDLFLRVGVGWEGTLLRHRRDSVLVWHSFSCCVSKKTRTGVEELQSRSTGVGLCHDPTLVSSLDRSWSDWLELAVGSLSLTSGVQPAFVVLHLVSCCATLLSDPSGANVVRLCHCSAEWGGIVLSGWS